MKNLYKIVTLIYCVALSPKIFAVDGVLEINHTCATQLGCFSGDSAGYPVVINSSAAKSYRLTSDLIIPDVNTNGISIQSSNITLDLNGFSLISVACFDTLADCTAASGTGFGISMSNTGVKGTTIKNGSVIGMGRRGLSIIGHHSRLENLNVRWNREIGIIVNPNSIVLNNNVSNNGGTGISASDNTIIKGNIVSFNTSTGINCGLNCIIRENDSHNNGSTGISGSTGSLIDKNNVHNNSSNGIFASRGSNVINNVSFQNGGDGILVASFDGSKVQNNMVHSNTGFGLRLSSGNHAYSQNTIINNTGGTVSQGFDMGDNFCETNKVCP